MFKFGKYKNVSSFKYHKKFLDFESTRKHGKQAYKNFKSKVFESLKLQKTWKENARVLNSKAKKNSESMGNVRNWLHIFKLHIITCDFF